MEADTTEVSRARFAISAETFALLSYAALAALFLIVVSGATVRLTGSGLGCDNWPRCGSSFLPEKNFHALVEYGNRGVGFVVGLSGRRGRCRSRCSSRVSSAESPCSSSCTR
jgi:heme A synthase